MANTIFMSGLVVAAYSNEKTAEAMSPGHLIEIDDTTDIQKLTASLKHRRAVALENNIGGDMTTAYAVGDTVNYAIFAPGSRVRLRLSAQAPAITKGDALGAHTDGTVRKITSGASVAIALETKDNSTGSTEIFIEAELK